MITLFCLRYEAHPRILLPRKMWDLFHCRNILKNLKLTSINLAAWKKSPLKLSQISSSWFYTYFVHNFHSSIFFSCLFSKDKNLEIPLINCQVNIMLFNWSLTMLMPTYYINTTHNLLHYFFFQRFLKKLKMIWSL